jgi:hypothetical protein
MAITRMRNARMAAAVGALFATVSLSMVGAAEVAYAVPPCKADCHAPAPPKPNPPIGDTCQLCTPAPGTPPPPPPPPPAPPA